MQYVRFMAIISSADYNCAYYLWLTPLANIFILTKLKLCTRIKNSVICSRSRLRLFDESHSCATGFSQITFTSQSYEGIEFWVSKCRNYSCFIYSWSTKLNINHSRWNLAWRNSNTIYAGLKCLSSLYWDWNELQILVFVQIWLFYVSFFCQRRLLGRQLQASIPGCNRKFNTSLLLIGVAEAGEQRRIFRFPSDSFLQLRN